MLQRTEPQDRQSRERNIVPILFPPVDWPNVPQRQPGLAPWQPRFKLL